MATPKSLFAILLLLAISKLLHQQIYTGSNDNTIIHLSQSSFSPERFLWVLFYKIRVGSASSRHSGFTRFPQPKLKSTKHGLMCLKIPGKDPDFDLVVFMDVERNPGPPEVENSRSSQTFHSLPLCSFTCCYSRETLLSLRRYTTSNLPQELPHTLKDLDILRFRGAKAGRQSKNREKQVSENIINNWNEQINVRITNRDLPATASQNRGRNQSHIKRVPYAKSFEVPSILSTNICNLSNKIDELHQVAIHNKTDVICLTESWLSQLIPDSAVSLPGFLLLRNDRENQPGGGVCVYIKEIIPCKRLVEMEQEEVESLCVQLRPHSLPRNISIIILGVVYYSTANGEAENATLRDHIQKNMDMYLSKHPNALVILTGDFNPTSTGLCSDSIARPNHLKQLVKFNTRDSGILDCFLLIELTLSIFRDYPNLAHQIITLSSRTQLSNTRLNTIL